MHVLVMAHGLISIDSVPTSPTCVTVRQIYVCAVCSFKRESLKVFQMKYHCWFVALKLFYFSWARENLKFIYLSTGSRFVSLVVPKLISDILFCEGWRSQRERKNNIKNGRSLCGKPIFLYNNPTSEPCPNDLMSLFFNLEWVKFFCVHQWSKTLSSSC